MSESRLPNPVSQTPIESRPGEPESRPPSPLPPPVSTATVIKKAEVYILCACSMFCAVHRTSCTSEFEQVQHIRVQDLLKVVSRSGSSEVPTLYLSINKVTL